MQDPSSDASSAEALPEREEAQPCYVELGMRKDGDRRLASVYKPGQRAKLQVSVINVQRSASWGPSTASSNVCSSIHGALDLNAYAGQIRR